MVHVLEDWLWELAWYNSYQSVNIQIDIDCMHAEVIHHKKGFVAIMHDNDNDNDNQVQKGKACIATW